MLKGFMINPYDVDKVAADVTLAKQLGANCVRWQLVNLQYAPQATNYGDLYFQWLEGRLQVLTASLPLLSELGMQVILDLHSPPTENFTPFTKKAARTFYQSWDLIAQRYKSNNSIVAYDLMNEPPVQYTGYRGLYNDMMENAARNIRVADKTKTIIAECPYGDPAKARILKPLTVKNWKVSYHQYYPLTVSHAAVGVAYAMSGKIWKNTEANYQKLKDSVSPILKYSKDNKVPVFVGEFSCARWSGYPNNNNRLAYYTHVMRLFKEYKWEWCYHALKEAEVWELGYGWDPADLVLNYNRPEAQVVISQF